MEIGILVFIHVLGAAIWAGGHLILALGFLPRAIKENNFEIIERFESRYDKIGITALVVQIITGIRLAMIYVPRFTDWFGFDNALSLRITLKLILLLLTLIIAVHAKKRLVPAKNMKALAIHIITVTVIAVLLVYVGVSFSKGALL